jgi:hypothetical protein
MDNWLDRLQSFTADMQLNVIGPHPFEREQDGAQKVRIGTLFPEYPTLYTQPPGVHAWQRSNFIEHLNESRRTRGLPPLSAEEEEHISANSVDLVFDRDQILIRPDWQRIDLAFAADELLQTLVSKRQISFLGVSDRRAREAIKHRGEAWRLCALPKTREGKRLLIAQSKVAIGGLQIYYYNRLTGTRWLTIQEFEKLERLDDTALAQHLQEIALYANLRTRLGKPEVDFFASDIRRFGAREFAGRDFDRLSPGEVRARFEELRGHFRSSVHEAYRDDDFSNRAWAERMMATLFLEGSETQTEQILSGLSPEFFLQIEWLPGGRFEDGEFLFDSVFDEATAHPEDPALSRLCDTRTKGIIFNIIREYGDLEYINVGCLPESLSLKRPLREGRRGVYIVEFHPKSEFEPVRRFLRLQKWDVWEHLDQGKDLLRAIRESEDYTDYCLDRRLGCSQLGMTLTRRVSIRRLTEIYEGSNLQYRGESIRTTYFEREYVPGVATDKLPLEKYARPGYALRLARLLGRAAATSIIIGRAIENGARPLFDDGDEVVIENEQGFPTESLVADHTGAFGEYHLPLTACAEYYARPVNSRDKFVSQPQEFARVYLEELHDRFRHIQGDYAKRRRAFDNLFKHCKYDPAGSFAFRWECVLRRLLETDADALVEAIKSYIRVMKTPEPELAMAK